LLYRNVSSDSTRLSTPALYVPSRTATKSVDRFNQKDDLHPGMGDIPILRLIVRTVSCAALLLRLLCLLSSCSASINLAWTQARYILSDLTQSQFSSSVRRHFIWWLISKSCASSTRSDSGAFHASGTACGIGQTWANGKEYACACCDTPDDRRRDGE
jgi:hypothetical protein